MFQEFLHKVVGINTKNGTFLKGKLVEITADFLKIQTLSHLRYVAIQEIVDIRCEEV